MKRITLTFALLIVGALAAQLVPVLRHSQVVHAQTGSCIIKGKQAVTNDGTLVCDCTVTTATNCTCKVTCPAEFD